jgi:hypothetical protein
LVEALIDFGNNFAGCIGQKSSSLPFGDFIIESTNDGIGKVKRKFDNDTTVQE